MNECVAQGAPLSKENLEKAERYFDSGVIYYTSKQYDKALTDFQAGYAISHLPDFLVNLSNVCSKLERYNEATKYLEEYLQNCPNAPDVAEVRQRIDELKIAAAIKEGDKPPPPPPSRWPPAPALALVGSGVVMIIIGGGLGGGAIAAARAIGDPANQDTYFGSDQQATEARGKAMQSAGIAFDVLGGMALTAGAIWSGVWLYRHKNNTTVSMVPHAGGLLLLGRF